MPRYISKIQSFLSLYHGHSLKTPSKLKEQVTGAFFVSMYHAYCTWSCSPYLFSPSKNKCAF